MVVGDVTKSIDGALDDVKAICEPEEVVEEVVANVDKFIFTTLDGVKAVREPEEVLSRFWMLEEEDVEKNFERLWVESRKPE